ncbi:helix-turn-helix domain-containing protein [Rhodoglobus sp. NPDC076762]
MTQAPRSSEVTSIPLDSMKRMRALAHPLRMKLLAELRVTSPATVGALATQFGESAGSVSYHLKALAAGGFIERAAGVSEDRRETWWQARHDFTEFAGDSATATPEFRESNNQLRHQAVDVLAGELHTAIERERELTAEWVSAGGSSDIVTFLSPAELSEARDELMAVLSKWHSRSDRARTEARAAYLIGHAIVKP